MVIFHCKIFFFSNCLLVTLGNHAILNLSPSWKDVTSIQFFSFYKWPLARQKSFNVQSICSLAHMEEMSRSIICTCTGKGIWHGDKNDRFSVKVYLSRSFARLRYPGGIIGWKKRRIKLRASTIFQLSSTMNHQKEKIKCCYRCKSLWSVTRTLLDISQIVSHPSHVMVWGFEELCFTVWIFSHPDFNLWLLILCAYRFLFSFDTEICINMSYLDGKTGWC